MKFRLAEIYRGCPKGGTPSLKKEWRIIYFPGGKRKTTKGSINYAKTIKQREKLAKDLKDQLDTEVMESYARKKSAPILPIREAMEWGLEKAKKHWKPGSLKEYRTPLNFFYKACDEMGINGNIGDIDTPLMMDIVDRMCQDREVGAYMYIKYKTNLGRIFQTLVDYRKIPYNPCNYKPPVRKPKRKAKKLLTKAQSIAVYNKIISSHFPKFINYLAILNTTGIRPKEIYSLKVSSIDLKNKVIFVPAEDVKDAEDRIVPIPKVLEPYLKELKLSKYSEDHYVFGIDFEPELRSQPVKRDKATKTWNQLIMQPKDKGGLGIPSKMYWLKHLGMRDAREAGVGPEAIQFSRGHASYDESLGYIGLDTEKNRKELIEKTPDPWKKKS